MTFLLAYNTSLAYDYVVRGINDTVGGPTIVTKAPDGTINTLSVGPGVLENSRWPDLATAQAANLGQIVTFNLTQPGPIGVQMPPGSDYSPGIAQPSGLSVTQSGTAGSTEYSYRVSALNGSGETQSAEVATVTGNATLSSSNYNVVTWTAVSGASSYNVYGRTLGTEMYLNNVSSGTTYNDTGADTPSTTQGPQATDTTQVQGVTYTIAS